MANPTNIRALQSQEISRAKFEAGSVIPHITIVTCDTVCVRYIDVAHSTGERTSLPMGAGVALDIPGEHEGDEKERTDLSLLGYYA